jgi:hypothetical protein
MPLLIISSAVGRFSYVIMSTKENDNRETVPFLRMYGVVPFLGRSCKLLASRSWLRVADANTNKRRIQSHSHRRKTCPTYHQTVLVWNSAGIQALFFSTISTIVTGKTTLRILGVIILFPRFVKLINTHCNFIFVTYIIKMTAMRHYYSTNTPVVMVTKFGCSFWIGYVLFARPTTNEIEVTCLAYLSVVSIIFLPYYSRVKILVGRIA